MINIITALYQEAEPFIQSLSLKKDLSFHKFQLFKNKDIHLLITGVGKVKAAIAVTHLLSYYPPSPVDFLVNVGLCGTSNLELKIGTPILCNKIIDRDTNHSYYPDMLFNHPFIERSVKTYSKIINRRGDSIGELVDMEAVGIYQAASTFFQPHQLIFIKVISDYLEAKAITQSTATNLIKDQVHIIIDWLNLLMNHSLFNEPIINQKEQSAINHIVRNLKLTTTMENQFIQLLRSYKLQHGDVIPIINDYMGVNCQSKIDGKKYFAELKQKLIES